jgi:hypothetical protein
VRVHLWVLFIYALVFAKQLTYIPPIMFVDIFPPSFYPWFDVQLDTCCGKNWWNNVIKVDPCRRTIPICCSPWSDYHLTLNIWNGNAIMSKYESNILYLLLFYGRLFASDTIRKLNELFLSVCVPVTQIKCSTKTMIIDVNNDKTFFVGSFKKQPKQS